MISARVASMRDFDRGCFGEEMLNYGEGSGIGGKSRGWQRRKGKRKWVEVAREEVKARHGKGVQWLVIGQAYMHISIRRSSDRIYFFVLVFRLQFGSGVLWREEWSIYLFA